MTQKLMVIGGIKKIANTTTYRSGGSGENCFFGPQKLNYYFLEGVLKEHVTRTMPPELVILDMFIEQERAIASDLIKTEEYVGIILAASGFPDHDKRSLSKLINYINGDFHTALEESIKLISQSYENSDLLVREEAIYSAEKRNFYMHFKKPIFDMGDFIPTYKESTHSDSYQHGMPMTSTYEQLIKIGFDDFVRRHFVKDTERLRGERDS
jgi:hypothetical protein